MWGCRDQLHSVMSDGTVTCISDTHTLLLVDGNETLVKLSDELPIPKIDSAKCPSFRLAVAHPEAENSISETFASRLVGMSTVLIARQSDGSMLVKYPTVAIAATKGRAAGFHAALDDAGYRTNRHAEVFGE